MIPQITVHAETHQIRNLTYAAEANGYTGLVRAVEMRHLFGRSIHLHQIRASLSPASFTRRRRRFEHAVDRLIFRIFLPEVPETDNARRLQARNRRHRASLFASFDRPDGPPTNNASEPDLRPSIIRRKVTLGHRSAWGAEASVIWSSILATARKQAQTLLDAFHAIAGPSPLQAIPARP